MLEDINPTDDELRESQQRVRLPRREARIGEAGGRGGAGSSTAGVIGGWLGAAATVGLSTASAGLSTVTGVAGATASAGLSTVTGVAGAMAGRASGATKREEDPAGGGDAGAAATAATAPGTMADGELGGREAAAAATAAGAAREDHRGDGGGGGSGGGRDSELAGTDSGRGARVGREVEQLQEVDVQVCFGWIRVFVSMLCSCVGARKTSIG